MKPTAFCILLLAACPFLFGDTAQEPSHWWGSYNTPGNLLVDLHLNTDFQNRTMLRGSGEFIVSKFFVNDVMPLDLGFNITGMAGFNTSEFQDNAVGAGAGVTAHIGFRGFGGRFGEILEKTDVFADLGAGYTHMLSDEDVKSWSGIDNSPVSWYSTIGIGYHLTDTAAVTLGNANWGSHSGIFVGFRIKSAGKQPIGARPHTPQTTDTAQEAARSAQKELDSETGSELSGSALPRRGTHEPLSDGEVGMYLSLFKKLYGGVFSHGGFMIDDYNFIDGEGAVYIVKIYDEAAEEYRKVEISKALISRGYDKSIWTYTINLGNEGVIVYEFTLNDNDLLTRLAVIHNGVVSVHEAEYPMEWNNAIVMFQNDFPSYTTGQETRSLAFGSFTCDRMFYDAGDFTYSWLVSDDIPGYVIEFGVEENGRIIIDGRLKEITLTNTSVIGD